MSSNRTRNWKRWLWFAAFAAVGGICAALGWRMKPAPPPLPPLPAETVTVEVVKEIVKIVPGPERIVERIRWRTREIEVEKEVVKEVIKVVEQAVGTGTLFALAGVEAEKYEGVEQGEFKFGWKGTINCKVRASKEESWTQIVEEPLDLSSSTSITTIAPVVRTPFRWRLEGRLGGWVDKNGLGIDVGATYYPWRRVGFYAGFQTGDSTSLLVSGVEESIPIDLVTDSRVYGGGAITLGKLR